MKKLLFAGLAVLVAVFALANYTAFSQEEEVKYSYGIVSQAGSGTITINEVDYNEDTGEETTMDIVYTVGPDAQIENAASITEIKTGSEVDIEYVEQD
ncbi:MAG: hypothetical protein ABH883_04110, partial [Candidatus Omnitrophota bacterium]